MTPYAAATRARSSASRISSPCADSGTPTIVAGGIRSRAASTHRTSDSAEMPSAVGPPTGISTSRWPVERAGGVRQLGQLRPVQRTVGEDPEHPARRQQLADLGRGTPQPPERPLLPVADAPDAAADADRALAGGPALGDVDGRDRRALGIGEHQDPPQRVVDVELLGDARRHLQRHRHRPRRAVDQAAGAGQRTPRRRGRGSR